MKVCVVVPTIREAQVQDFLAAWGPQFRRPDRRVVVVEDNPERSFTLPDWVHHVSWEEIDKDLGKDAWIIPRRSGAIRNYGVLVAARKPFDGWEPDMIVMLDDDCLPSGTTDFLGGHWNALETPGDCLPMLNTLHMMRGVNGVRPRGYPQERRSTARTVVNHGLWNRIPDLDGRTQLAHPGLTTRLKRHSLQVPVGTLFPLSAMNVAFRREFAPAMYQLPMGQGQPYHRFDDIWCGWIMKKAADAMGLAVRSGSPMVEHLRASNAHKNAELEAPGIEMNEKVWREVAETYPPSVSLDACLTHIHSRLKHLGDYWEMAARAAAIWREMLS